MWKVGDRVVVVEAPSRTTVPQVGCKGTLIDIQGLGILVKFDNLINENDGTWHCRNGKLLNCCYSLYEEDSYLVSWALGLKCKWIPKKRNNNFY